jgi:hypothetical protein
MRASDRSLGHAEDFGPHSGPSEDFGHFTGAIDRCLDELPTVHNIEMETLLTHKFQTFGDVPLLAESSITGEKERLSGWVARRRATGLVAPWKLPDAPPGKLSARRSNGPGADPGGMALL